MISLSKLYQKSLIPQQDSYHQYLKAHHQDLKDLKLQYLRFSKSQNIMNLFDLDKVANMLVRPLQQTYRKNDLERVNLVINKKKHFRRDFTINLNLDQHIECSFFSQHFQNCVQKSKCCMIYLHCNTGCRIQGLPYVIPLLQQNISVLLFDFRGSGHSSGKYISLGVHQSKDIQIIVNYLLQLNPTIEIGLWGRSMGSVAALHYCARNLNIRVAILDSPFVSLERMMVKIGKSKTFLPEFLMSFFFRFLNPYIYEKVGFNIEDLNNLKFMKQVKVPLLFVTSTRDKVVGTEEVQTLYQEYQGSKQIIYITKDHHQTREKGTIQKIVSIARGYFAGLNGSVGLQVSPRVRRREQQKQSIKTMMKIKKQIIKH